MATCIQVPVIVPSSLRSSSSISTTTTTTCSSSFDMNPKIGWRNYVRRKRLNYICSSSSSKIPLPPADPNDPVIRRVAAYVGANPGIKPSPADLKDLLTNPTMPSSGSSGVHGIQGSRRIQYKYGYGRHKTNEPPPDVASMLLDARIIYLGLPMVPLVTELIMAQFLYLSYSDDTEPITLYINSTGTTLENNRVVANDCQGFAILNAMECVKNDVETVCLGSAAGYACLLLAAGKFGRRFMLPHCRIVMRAPYVPATGLMQATDVSLRAKQATLNRDMFFKLFAFYTGHRLDDVKEKLQYPFYMGAKEALDFGVVDEILWQGQEKEMPELLTPEQWEKLSRGRLGKRPTNYNH